MRLQGFTYVRPTGFEPATFRVGAHKENACTLNWSGDDNYIDGGKLYPTSVKILFYHGYSQAVPDALIVYFLTRGICFIQKVLAKTFIKTICGNYSPISI